MSKKKNKIHIIRYHLHSIPNESNIMKIMLKKNVRSSLSLYSIRQQNSQSQPLRKKKRKQATNVQFVSENIVRMIGHGSNFLRPRKKWPLLYNRPINMKTIRDSLSLFLSLFSSLVLFGLYDLLYGFRAIRQIKFCLFGTIIYSALHFFLGNPTIYLFADVFDRLHHLKQRRKRGKKNIPTT